MSFVLFVAAPGAASDRCTIEYSVNATLQVTDTYLTKGDLVAKNLPGSLVMQYELDRDGVVADGKVQLLHFAMFERVIVSSIVDVTTVLHHFTPACNGIETPAWRRTSDPGFPAECRYAGGGKAVAVGKLSRAQRTINWARCKAAPSYWSSDRGAYRTALESKGRGCLNEMHAVGTIHCDGGFGCKLGKLDRGERTYFDVWNQPMIHGPPEAPGQLLVSENLRTVSTPTGRKDGFQSYNLPNDAPSRTWFSWVATRIDDSRYTTCP